MENLTRREFLGVSLLGIAGTLIGCAEKTYQIERLDENDQIPEIVRQNINLFRKSYGYWIQKNAEDNLKTMAGILAGNLRVKRDGNISSIEGNYSRLDELETYEEALRLADVDRDYAITSKESMAAAQKLIKQIYR